MIVQGFNSVVRETLALLLDLIGHRSNAEGILLRLNLMRLPSDTSYQTSDAVLELAVLGGVDQRIDDAAGEHQYHSEVVEPAGGKHFMRHRPIGEHIN